MARKARIVLPGIPHHVVQRGNRRQAVFFESDDYAEYIKLMSLSCAKHGVSVWAYCLMRNHIHLIVVPKEERSLSQGIGEGHIRYTRYINFKKRWRGHLWQGRFSSFPMDEGYLYEVVRYVELNPVRAHKVSHAGSYKWSSAKAHLKGKDDSFVKVKPMQKRVKDWRSYLREGLDRDVLKRIRENEISGLPLGDDSFLEPLENMYGWPMKKLKPGPKGDN